MATCAKSFDFKVGAFDRSGYESVQKAREAVKKALTDFFQMKKENECVEGDCDTKETRKKCSLSWSYKALDDFINGLDIDEYNDDDGDYSYSIDVPAHTFKLECKCVRRRGRAEESKLI